MSPPATRGGLTAAAAAPDGRGGRRRLLVALLLSGRVETEITGVRRAVTGSPGRLVPHLTLVPPVNVAGSELGAALAIVQDAAAASPPLALELGPPATFAGSTAVLHLAVGGDLDALAELRASLEVPPLAPPDGRPGRPFVPHVTIASRLEPSHAERLAAELSGLRLAATCTGVQLLEEVDEPGGRRWVVIASEALGGRAVRGRGGLEVAVQLADRLDPEAAGVVEEAWAGVSAAAGEAMAAGRPFAFVARREREVLGAATGTICGEVCELHRLVVVAAARGQGTGSRLLEAVERLAGEEGCAKVRVLALAGGAVAAFLSRRGFQLTSTLPGWRAGRDAVVMERRQR